MLPRSFIALEAQSVDLLQVKSVQKTRNNPSALSAVLKAYKKQLHSEQNLPIDPNLLKSKRQIVLARQHEISLVFQMDIDQIQFAFEDNAQSMYNFNQNKTFLSSQMVLYLQPTEKRLASQKTKLMQRITGFTREIIDSIHEDRVEHPDIKTMKTLHNKVIYTLQDCLKRLLSEHYLPDLSTLEICLFNDTPEMPCLLHDPVILLNALQYLDALASHNTTHLFKKTADRTRYELTLTQFNSVIPYVFQFIRNAYSTPTHDVHITSLIVYQTVKTLRAVLNVMMSLHTDMLTNNKDSTPNNNNNNGNRVRANTALDANPSSKASLFWDNCCGSVEYTMTHMATDLILLLKIIKLARLSRVDHKCSDEVFCIHGLLPGATQQTIHVNSQCMCDLLAALQPYARIGAFTATNLMHCADNVISLLITTTDLSQPWSSLNTTSNTNNTNTNTNTDAALDPLSPPIPPKNTPRIFNSLAHELLLSALNLGLICVEQYSVRLGHVGGVSSHILSDNIYVQSCDRESTAAINLATTAFAHNILDAVALRVFRAAFDLTVPRSGSFLLMSSFLKCCLAGCLLAVNWLPGVDQVEDTQFKLFAEKQRVYFNYLAEERQLLEMRLSGTSGIKKVTCHPGGGTTSPQLQSSQAVETPSAVRSNNKTNVVKHISFSDDAPHNTIAVEQLSSLVLSDNQSDENHNTILLQPDRQLAYKFRTKGELVQLMNECTLCVMSVMFLHRTSLSICHVGMIVVRLLTRDLFIKKARIDEYFVAHLAHVLKPQVDLYIASKKSEEDEEEFYEQQQRESVSPSGTASPQNSTAFSTAQNSSENLKDLLTGQSSMLSSVSRSSSPTDTLRRPLTSGGSGITSGAMSSSSFGSKKGKQLSAKDHLQAWRMATLPKILEPHQSPTDYTFMELLHYIGDNHMQSVDVTEQLLLLIAHIANKSQLNKYLLMEASIQPIVQRVREGQVDNVYFMALSEICQELMEV